MDEILKLAGGIQQKFDLVLLAGSASLNSIKHLKSICANKILWFEPDQVGFLKIKKQVAKLGIKNVELHNMALTTSVANEVELYQSSSYGFTSLFAPLEIAKIRPGIKFQKRLVYADDIQQVLKTAQISNANANLLLLNTNGSELDIIKELDSELFSSILIRTSNRALYKSESNSKSLGKLFEEQASSYISLDESLPPFKNLIIVRDANWHQSKKIEDLQNKLQSLYEQLEVTQASYDKENDILKQELLSATDKIEELNSAYEKAITDSNNKLNALKKEHDALINERNLLSKEKDDVSASMHNLETKTKEFEDLKTHASSLESNITTLKEEYQKANENQERAMQTLSLNTKLMTKLEVDADDLRKTIATKNAEEKELKALIRELHEKLKLASAFYHQVEQNYPEMIKHK